MDRIARNLKQLNDAARFLNYNGLLFGRMLQKPKSYIVIRHLYLVEVW